MKEKKKEGKEGGLPMQEPVVNEQEDNPTEVKERIIHLRLRRRNKRPETIVTGMDDLIAEDKTLLPRLRTALFCNCELRIDPDTQQQYLRFMGDQRGGIKLWLIEVLGIIFSKTFL